MGDAPDPELDPTPGPEPGADGRTRRGWRLLLRLVIALGVVLGLVVMLVAFVVLTPMGTGFALRRAVEWYDGRVPGSVTFRDSVGPLGDLCLHDVRLADAEDRPLVTVRALCLDVRLGALLRRTAKIEALTVAGATIHLWPTSTWSDLSVPKPAPPPSELPGPDLPVRVEGPLMAWTLEVVRHDDTGQGQPLVRNAGLHAAVAAEGRWAHVQLRTVWGEVPQVPVFVIGGRAELDWASPTLAVEELELASSAGIVRALSGHLDVRAQRYAARLRALAFVPPTTAPPAVTAEVELAARGSAQAVRAAATVRTEQYGHAELDAVAQLQPSVAASVVVHAEPGGALPIETPVDAWVTARIDEGEDPRALAFVTTPGALVVASWVDLQARAEAFLSGARARMTARVEDGALRTAEATVTVGSAASATAALDRILAAEVPRLEGSGQVDAACRSGEALRCEVQAAVRREGDWVELAAGLEQREGRGDATRLAIDLRRLTGQLRGEPVRLAEPASLGLALEEGWASLSSLRLVAAGGTIAAAGRVDWSGDRPSDLAVELRGLDLGVIPRFVPGVPIRGRLDGALTLQGELEQPELRAALALRRLGWGEDDLGRLTLRARYDDARATAEARWRLGAARARVLADVPLVLDPRGEAKLRWRTDAPVNVSVDLSRLDLARASEWIGGPTLAGRVRATVRAGGPLGDPIVIAKLTGTHLEIDDEDLGNAEITAMLRDDRLAASVAVVGDAVGRVRVDGSLPLAIDPSRGWLRYRPHGHHHLAAQLVGADLRQLEPWLTRAEDEVPPGAIEPQELAIDMAGVPDPRGELALRGHVRGELEATAEDGEVRGSLALIGYDLHAYGIELGAAQVDVELEPAQVLTRVVLSGPWARLVELGARVPLELRTPGEPPRWHAQEPLAARLVLSGVDLAVLSRLGGSRPLAGELEGTLDVSGTPREPTLAAELEMDDLRSADERLGHAKLQASYDGDAIEAWFEQEDGAQEIELSTRVPLRMNLAAPAVEWKRDEEHRVSLRAQGVDDELLRAFVELPRDLGLQAAARVEGYGTIDDPRLTARVRGSVVAEGSIDMPVSVLVALRPQEQHARVVLGSHGPKNLRVEARAEAPLPEVLRGTADFTRIPVDVQAKAEGFPLRDLSPLLPDALHDPSGALQLAASLQGTIDDPTLQGEVRIDDAAITVVPLNQELTHIHLRATLDGPDVVLENLSARSGNGSTSATARLHLEPGHTRGTARVAAKRFPIVRPGLPMIQLDARVQAELDATGPTTNVDLRVHDAFLDVLELAPPTAAERIPSDEGVIYVDTAGVLERQRAEEEQTPWLPERVQLAVTLADPLRVRGPSADMDWRGHVEVVRPAEGDPSVTGTFQLTRGWVALLGNEFDVERAQIRFPEVGDLDPFIDLVATADTSEALVTMLVRGRMSRPTLQLRSEPSMPESDIFALLITGHADANQAAAEEFSAKAATVLAAVSNPELQRYMRERIGIDRVGVGFGDTIEQPIVTVGKRFSDKVYVEAGYHHNAPRGENSAEVRLEYRFAPPRWSVETWFGDAAEGGVGLWWRRRFAARGQRRVHARPSEPAAGPDDGSKPTTPKR